MPVSTFEAFKSELNALKDIVLTYPKKTVRDETLRERFRTLFRTWSSTVRPSVEPLLISKRNFFKLDAELESLAKLTAKIKNVTEYRKRLNRAIMLANGLVLYLPTTGLPEVPSRISVKDDLFIPGIPDLPLRSVPNPLIGWKRNIEAFVNRYPFDKSVFIMIRYRRRNDTLIKKLKGVLIENGLRGILASENNLTGDLYNPIACLFCCSKGIAVFDKPEEGQVFNPNVAYELGMMHLLGRECLILKHRDLQVLHADILMRLYCEYRTVKQAAQHIIDWSGTSD